MISVKIIKFIDYTGFPKSHTAIGKHALVKLQICMKSSSIIHPIKLPNNILSHTEPLFHFVNKYKIYTIF